MPIRVAARKSETDSFDLHSRYLPWQVALLQGLVRSEPTREKAAIASRLLRQQDEAPACGASLLAKQAAINSPSSPSVLRCIALAQLPKTPPKKSIAIVPGGRYSSRPILNEADCFPKPVI
jgi:hypothetical protein